MKKIVTVLLIIVGGFIWSCRPEDQDYKKFLQGKEIIYPGVPGNPNSRPGNLRAELLWNPSPDPSIEKYLIYWNNKADSTIFTSNDHNPADTLRVVIPDLNEYTYSFVIYSVDGSGNRSIPLDINNVKVYGPNYKSGLVNRTINSANPYTVTADGNLTLHFNPLDTAAERFSYAYNITTDILYTNRSGMQAQLRLAPTTNDILLTDYLGGTTLQYHSSYVPVPGAIDTFYVANAETFPQISSEAACNKSLFAKVKLPGDLSPYQQETDIDRLWDGSVGPQGYPDIFHSDGSGQLPKALTFDMGKIYSNITAVEETGRNCCHNPNDIEVWGIANISNAATTLDPNNAGWPDEMVSKGWIKLGEIKRTDDGSALMKFTMSNINTPVRYIRLRIISNVDGDNTYTNMSEITMYTDVLK